MNKAYDFSTGVRGAVVPPAPGKTRITLRIGNEILEWFGERADEAGGGSYQTMMNQALWDFVRGIETDRIVRRVVREEFAARREPRPRHARGPGGGSPRNAREKLPPETDSMPADTGLSEGERGAITPPPEGKTKTTIRIDDAILDWFRDAARRAGGGSYQTLMNQALRSCTRGVDTARIVRAAVREEFARHDSEISRADRRSG